MTILRDMLLIGVAGVCGYTLRGHIINSDSSGENAALRVSTTVVQSENLLVDGVTYVINVRRGINPAPGHTVYLRAADDTVGSAVTDVNGSVSIKYVVPGSAVSPCSMGLIITNTNGVSVGEVQLDSLFWS